MEDLCFAIKDENGFYYCGLKQWDKQIRKAQLFHSFKYAKAVRDDPRCTAISGTKIVRVRIWEDGECNPDWDM